MSQQITYSVKYKRNYVAFFAAALFFAMIGMEIFLAFSIPAYVRRENVLADEVRHREMLLRFDRTRRLCDAIRPKNEIMDLEKHLLLNALDQLALYLRAEEDRLTPEEVRELDLLTLQAEKLVSRMHSGKGFSRENRLDTTSYVDDLVKKHPVKGIL